MEFLKIEVGLTNSSFPKSNELDNPFPSYIIDNNQVSVFECLSIFGLKIHQRKYINQTQN